MIIFRMLNGGLLGRIDGCLRYVSGAGHLFIVERGVIYIYIYEIN